MDGRQLDALLVSLARSRSRREMLGRLAAGVLGLGGLSMLAMPAAARRHKKHKHKRHKHKHRHKKRKHRLGLQQICNPRKDRCKAGLSCDSPTTRHTCSSEVAGVSAWCCVPPGGRCTECDCCGDFFCDFGDANPEGACIPNPEG